jgi:hypothetical protein
VALGAALDEGISLDAARDEPALDERTRALSALETACEEQRRDAYAAALTLVHKRSRGMSAEMKARAARCAARCLAHEPAQKIALAVIRALPPVKDPVELRSAWIDELRDARLVSKTATAIELELLRAKDAGMHRALLALICAEPKAAARSARWIGMLSSSRDRAIAGDLKTWAESISPKDPRRSAAAEVVERIERARPPIDRAERARARMSACSVRAMGRGDDDAAGPAVGLLASMDRVEAVSVSSRRALLDTAEARALSERAAFRPRPYFSAEPTAPTVVTCRLCAGRARGERRWRSEARAHTDGR